MPEPWQATQEDFDRFMAEMRALNVSLKQVCLRLDRNAQQSAALQQDMATLAKIIQASGDLGSKAAEFVRGFMERGY